MADTTPTGEFNFDPEFFRRASCYLERNITQSDFLTFEQELRAEPIKRKTLVELCLSQTELFEEFRQEAEYARGMSPGSPAPDERPASHSSRAANSIGHRVDPFLILLERASHGTPRALAETSSIDNLEKTNRLSNIRSPAANRPEWRWRVAAGILLPLLAGLVFWQLHRSSDRATISLALNARLDGGAIAQASQALAAGPHTLDHGLMQILLAGGEK